MKTILNRIPRPPGAVPARAQFWVLVGLTGAIAATLVTFPGQADEQQPKAAAGAAPSGGVGVNSIDEAARRMQQEADREAEARLQRELGLSAPRADGLPHPPQPAAPEAAPDRGWDTPSQGPTVEDQIAREERVRWYRSLRTPPVVRSVRGSEAPQPVPPADGGSGARIPAAAKEGVPGRAPTAGAASVAGVPEPMSRAVGYMLREGEFLEAVLANRLSGDFAGPVNAMISADVHDRSRQHLLIPRGSRALGAAVRVEDWGQVRLAVTFHRLIFPNGEAVSLGKSTGLNQTGDTGLRDQVDRHYLSTLTAAGAVGALAGLSMATSPREAFGSRLGSARLSAGSGLSRSAERVLDRYLNRLPKVTIREGHRIRIHLTEDLMRPAYPGGSNRIEGDLP